MDELTDSQKHPSRRIINMDLLMKMSPQVQTLLAELGCRKKVVDILESILRFVSAVRTDVTEEEVTTTAKSVLGGQADSVMAQILDTWMVEGWLERLRQGEEQQSERAWLHVGIERMLDLKFGAAGLALLPDLCATDDVDTLRATLGATITADTLDELRAALSS